MNRTVPFSAFPESHEINTRKLLQVFRHTTTSYKYLFFMALLQMIKKSHYRRYRFSLQDIAAHMLAIAWYPYTYFKLSFGLVDTIGLIIDKIQLEGEIASVVHNPFLFNALEDELVHLVQSEPAMVDHVLRFVPYRLLTPFFSRTLSGMPDARKNARIERLARERFDDLKPLYRIDAEREEIVMHPAWMHYLNLHSELIWAYVKWQWLEYMQKRNPSVPNVQAKLFPETKKPAMVKQLDFWKCVLTHDQMTCIYSGKALQVQEISLDHFIPWTFVAHNQLWNLIPTLPSVNSSKSNRLPSLQLYFDAYVEMQHRGLKTYQRVVDSLTWKRTIEPYQMDLKIRADEILNQHLFASSMRSMVYPLAAMAEHIGFIPNWEYLRDKTAVRVPNVTLVEPL